MKTLFKILIFLLTIFYINSEAKTFVIDDVISEAVIPSVLNSEKSNVELKSVFSENGIVNTCKRERDLIDYRNLLLISNGTVAKGEVHFLKELHIHLRF